MRKGSNIKLSILLGNTVKQDTHLSSQQDEQNRKYSVINFYVIKRWKQSSCDIEA